MGEITKEKLAILRDADAIFREEIANAGMQRDINQYFAVLTNNRSVGVMGDFRTYDYTLALRGVTTTDFMTADWARIPYDVLDKISSRIVNEVDHINASCTTSPVNHLLPSNGNSCNKPHKSLNQAICEAFFFSKVPKVTKKI